VSPADADDDALPPGMTAAQMDELARALVELLLATWKSKRAEARET